MGVLNGAAVLIALQVLAALVIVVIASEAFTNAVEWVGAIFGLTRSAVGSVVAAIGSSLPETIIAIIALLILHDHSSQEIGIGAVLGAPFMLGTVVFFLIGATAMMRPRRGEHRLNTPAAEITFGAGLFSVTFALVLGASFARGVAVHIAASVLVLAAYGLYLWYHLRLAETEGEEEPPPLLLSPRAARPRVAAVFLQLAIALVVTSLASRWFVGSVAQASTAVGISPFLISLFLSPIATELPEASNVVLWMRRRKDHLAVGNVLGAMMFQTSIASAIAMLATPWQLEPTAYAASCAALLSTLILTIATAWRKRVDAGVFLLGGFLFLAYIAYQVFARG